MRYAIGIAASLLLLATPEAQAQGAPANCHGMFTATLASGRPHGDLSQCKAELIPLIVHTLEQAHARSDTTYLATLVMYASDYRHPDVFSAAADLAQDRAAPRAARMAGLMILASEHEHNLAPRGAYNSREELLSRAIPLTCQWEASTSEYTVNEPLPADHLERIRSIARALHRPDEDAAVRNFAGCLLGYANGVVPETPGAGAITVENKCGTVFIIRNASDVAAAVRWAIDGVTDSGGEFEIRPRSAVTFQAFDKGTLLVFLGTQRVGAATSSDTDCR